MRDFEAAWLLDGLIRNSIDPRRVIVEVTEREPIADLARLRRNLDHLQEYGVRLAADDVGAGNSGLRLLSQVRFDVVKIDMSLVQESAVQLGSRAVLRSINDLALHQEALVIAEGVETQEQLRFVQGLGIQAAQGYLLGRPSSRLATEALDLESLVPVGGDDDPRPGETASPPMPPLPEPAPRMAWPVKDFTPLDQAPGLARGRNPALAH
jgi:EAL domain-containing protein (putative c-di-GMP-specific phosphodiesterase class I)